MPHSFIVEAKPLECGSAAAAFTAIANTGIRPKAAAALPHSKAPFGRSLAFDSHFRLHPLASEYVHTVISYLKHFYIFLFGCIHKALVQRQQGCSCQPRALDHISVINIDAIFKTK
jgi:hypothetical protein